MQTIQRKPSFHEISPREYMYFPMGTLEMGKPGKFSRLELSHIGIAMVVLTICFTFTLSLNNLLWCCVNGFQWMRFPQGFMLSLIAVFCAFFFHEMSHKITAQYYRLWSEFRMNARSLLISFALALTTGFVFAAPGKVMFRGQPRLFEEGHIALAGPLANMVLAGLFLPVYMVFFTGISGFIPQMVGFICLINIIFATFNLLPVKSFDGGRVIQWNKQVWLVLMSVSLLMMVIILPSVSSLLMVF